MKITEHYSLNKKQAELDFVNIDTSIDTPLFLDPYFISIRHDPWSRLANDTIRHFFQNIISLIRADEISNAESLFRNLNEPNETCLGLSRGDPQGRGMGPQNARSIFQSIIESRAVQMGVVNNLEDCGLLVEGIGRDKISDMVTNIIKKQLIDYTINQCCIWDIPLTPNTPSGFYWDPVTSTWDSGYCDMLVVDGKKILLVPKSIVSYANTYTDERFYNHFILNFLQQEHLNLNSPLVRTRYKKNGELLSRWVAKVDIKDETPKSKQFLRDFCTKNPEVLELFKLNSKTFIQKPNNDDLEQFDSNELANVLIESLQALPSGNANADNYNKLIAGILEFIFHPKLTCPIVEKKINHGRKRIDIVFNNSANTGFFSELHELHNVPCPYIIIECKNYSNDPSNPETDQLLGRFSPNRGKFGFLICRTITNPSLLMNRCSDANQAQQGKIIPLCDRDIINMLDFIRTGDLTGTEKLLTEKFRELNFN